MVKTSENHIIYSPDDISILNILRCQPYSSLFDFSGYGSLPLSVFNQLRSFRSQDAHTLNEVISQKTNRTLKIDSSREPNGKTHEIRYEKSGGLTSIIDNVHNNNSSKSDIKIFTTSSFKSPSGRTFDASMVAMEVYREKGNLKPIWQVGFYITDNNLSGNILLNEPVIIDVPQSIQRTSLIGLVTKFMLSLSDNITYSNSALSLNTNLENFILSNTDTERVSEKEAMENSIKWFRYLAGSLDIKSKLKIDDLYAAEGEPSKYRIILRTTHLTNEGDGYMVDIYNDFSLSSMGPFNKGQAEKILYNQKVSILSKVFQKSGFNSEQIAKIADSQDSLEYAALVYDKNKTPIILTTWIPQEDASLRYVALFTKQQNSLYQEEMVFPGEKHPRDQVKKILSIIPAIDYTGVASLSRIAGNYCIPIEISHQHQA